MSRYGLAHSRGYRTVKRSSKHTSADYPLMKPSFVAHHAWMLAAALVLVGCSGPDPRTWWHVHTQCPATTYVSLDWSRDGTRIVYAADSMSYGYSVSNLNLF